MRTILLAVQKRLHCRLYNKGGRGSSGNITVYHRGSLGDRRIYRYINFGSLNNTEGVVLSLCYDPNRTAYIALVYYLLGQCAYILAPEGLRVGSTLFSGNSPDDLEESLTVGARLPLKLLPIGFIVHNVELEPYGRGKLCRAAGAYAVILKKAQTRVLLKLRSNWNMWLDEDCFASLGVISNSTHIVYRIAKAGIVRRWGFRPVVRGIAKNPVDHPHGGRSNKGMHPTTPWGRLTKGHRTISYAKRLSKQSIRFR